MSAASIARELGPARTRSSPSTTPRSRSIAPGSSDWLLATSRIRNSESSITDAATVGKLSVYRVSVCEVKALVSAPKLSPSRSSSFTISPSGTFFDPLNAMCSMKCARPRWYSCSINDPASIRMKTLAVPGGVAFL